MDRLSNRYHKGLECFRKKLFRSQYVQAGNVNSIIDPEIILLGKPYYIIVKQKEKKARNRRTNEQIDKEVISELEKLVVIK